MVDFWSWLWSDNWGDGYLSFFLITKLLNHVCLIAIFSNICWYICVLCTNYFDRYWPISCRLQLISACETTNPTMHYNDVIMGTIASQITSLTIVYSTVYSDADQRKYQSSTSLAFVRGIHRRPVNYPHKWPVTRKMFPLDDVIMESSHYHCPQRSFVITQRGWVVFMTFLYLRLNILWASIL